MKKLNILLAASTLVVAGLTSCNGDLEMPPVTYPDQGSEETIGSGAWDNPMSVWQAAAGTMMESENDYVWVTGYIVGYINTSDGDYAKLREKSAMFTAEGAPNSNLMLASSPLETNWENCIPVQLEYGTSGRDLSLQKTPSLLGQQVTIKGKTGTRQYLGRWGVKHCINYNFGPEGFYEAPDVTFRRVLSIESGASYAFVASEKYMAKAVDENKTYGWLYTMDVAGTGNKFMASQSNAFTITSEGQGWTIVDSYGRYLWQTGSNMNFNVSESKPANGYLWTLSFNEDGTCAITNLTTGNTIQYDASHTSYGCYPDDRGMMPVIFKMDPNEN